MRSDGCENQMGHVARRSEQRRFIIQRHGSSTGHRCAERKMLKKAGYDTNVADLNNGYLVPSVTKYKTLLHDRREGLSMRSTTRSGIIGSITVQEKMTWTLREALRQKQRTFLRGAKCIAVNQDAGKGRTQIRIHAVNHSLESMWFMLALRQNTGTTGVDCMNATLAAIHDFCTPQVSPPRGVTVTTIAGAPDDALLAHMKDTVRAFCSDAGSDEILGIRLLIERGGFVRARHVLDKTHAWGRVVEKPQNADAFLQAVFNFWIADSGSVTNMIQHSPDIKRIFNRHVANVAEPTVKGRRVRSLSFSKIRFNSTAKPSGRAILWFEAVVATCYEVRVIRKGRVPAKTAQSFLSWIGSEKLLQMAMLADANVEALAQLRAFDTEASGAAALKSGLEHFLARIEFLFVEKGCGMADVGYTSIAIQILRRGFEIQVDATEWRQLRYSDEEFKTCCKRMVGWVRLVVKGLKAEFGGYELLFAWHIFDDALLKETEDDVDWGTSVLRVATSYGLDPTRLATEIGEVVPFVHRAKLRKPTAAVHEVCVDGFFAGLAEGLVVPNLYEALGHYLLH